MKRSVVLRGATLLAFVLAVFAGYTVLSKATQAQSAWHVEISLGDERAGVTSRSVQAEPAWSPFLERHVQAGPLVPRTPLTGEPPSATPADRFSVSGAVTNAGGQPLPGVPVEVWDAGQSERLSFAVSRTDDDGRFTVVSPVRDFVLRIPGGGTRGAGQSLVVSLPDGEVSLDGVRFVLEHPRVELAGTVRSPDGLPLRGLAVSLYDESGRVAAQTVTGRGGEYLFKELPYGRYRLALLYPLSGQGLWFGGGSEPSSATVFDLRTPAQLDLVAPSLG